MSLQNMIDTDIILTDDMIKKWNNLKDILQENHVSRIITLEGNIGYKYRHDFEGLLLYLDVPKELVYPHIVANNLNSSIDYDGDMFNITMLKNDILYQYLELFRT